MMAIIYILSEYHISRKFLNDIQPRLYSHAYALLLLPLISGKLDLIALFLKFSKTSTVKLTGMMLFLKYSRNAS